MRPGQISTVRSDASSILLGDSAEQEAHADALIKTAAAFGLSFADLSAVTPDEAALLKLPIAAAAQLGVLPLSYDGLTLTVATSHPGDLDLEQRLSALTGCEIDFVVSSRDMIEAALRRGGSAEKALENVSQQFQVALVRETERGNETVQLAEMGRDEAPIVRLVSGMIGAALEKRASDIHVHRSEDGVAVDFRIDGVLTRALGPFDPSYHAPLISRIKVMAELDIAEHRTPQDGRFKLRLSRGDVDFRVSVLPGIHGEDIVIRILDKAHLMESRSALSLESLGFESTASEILKHAARSPFGMLLVTGPTGSGKTTTLYACISEMDKDHEKIVTIEDPVEYELAGILQIPVNEKKNLTFAKGLRSILRHDPDRIMVGEIRDRETASIAIQAALTGHLVITTLHANNAFDVIARFTHMQIDLHELTAALNCVVAQRLLRKLCGKCSRARTYSPSEIASFNLDGAALEGRVWREGRGCDACFGTGYHGRTVAAEVLQLTEDLKRMIIERRPASEMREAARLSGMRSLREAALDKAAAGITSLAEVLRVT